MFISPVKFSILTWRSMGFDLLFESASSGHSRNCSFWDLHIGFIPQKLLLDLEQLDPLQYLKLLTCLSCNDMRHQVIDGYSLTLNEGLLNWTTMQFI